MEKKKRRNWWATASPEKKKAWIEKIQAGRRDWYAKWRSAPGRPKKINYKKGWDPAKKSAASKAQWEYRKKYRPDIVEKLWKNGQAVIKKRREKEAPLRAEREKAKTQGLKQKTIEEYKKEQQRLCDLATHLLADTGVVPEANMPLEYYQEIIGFFKNQEQ